MAIKRGASMEDGGEARAAARKRRNALARIVRSRDFTRDLVVTTLGVLIALGIGALVDEIRWRMRQAASERMMDEELAWVRGAFAYHLLSYPCVANRSEALFELIDDARKTKKLPDIRGIGSTRDFGTYGDSWNFAQSSDVMLHMTPKVAMDYSSIWVDVRYWADHSSRARLSWQAVNELGDRPGPVSDDLLDDATRDLIAAVRASETVVGMGLKNDEKFAKRGIKRLSPDGDPFDLKKLRADVSEQYICKPLMVDGKPYKLRESTAKPLPLPKDLQG
ncbi:hypothetical protein ABDK56_01235 [Sphingomonas sp. ASV193]|uniref:hypothetical protein n=1 Tax=Sphingomonas sp. ASV193 TaxID=3144405 RepID=UPI0032E863E1